MDQAIEAFRTGAGMLWKALWALVFGYTISPAIQVLVTREQMARALGERGGKQAGLAAFSASSPHPARSRPSQPPGRCYRKERTPPTRWRS